MTRLLASYAEPTSPLGFRARFRLPEGVSLQRYQKNGTLTRFHDLDAGPVGRCVAIDTADGVTTFDFEYAQQEADRPEFGQVAAAVKSRLLRVVELAVGDDGEVFDASLVSVPDGEFASPEDRGGRTDARGSLSRQRVHADGTPVFDPFETRLDARAAITVDTMDPPVRAARPAKPSEPVRRKSARELQHDQFFSRHDGGEDHNNPPQEDRMDPVEANRRRNERIIRQQRRAQENGITTAEQRHADFERRSRQDGDDPQPWERTLGCKETSARVRREDEFEAAHRADQERLDTRHTRERHDAQPTEFDIDTHMRQSGRTSRQRQPWQRHFERRIDVLRDIRAALESDGPDEAA